MAAGRKQIVFICMRRDDFQFVFIDVRRGASRIVLFLIWLAAV